MRARARHPPTSALEPPLMRTLSRFSKASSHCLSPPTASAPPVGLSGSSPSSSKESTRGSWMMHMTPWKTRHQLSGIVSSHRISCSADAKEEPSSVVAITCSPANSIAAFGPCATAASHVSASPPRTSWPRSPARSTRLRASSSSGARPLATPSSPAEATPAGSLAEQPRSSNFSRRCSLAGALSADTPMQRAMAPGEVSFNALASMLRVGGPPHRRLSLSIEARNRNGRRYKSTA